MDMEKPILLYSVNTTLAHYINHRYYGGIHYVWCTPYFHSENEAFLFRLNPVTSNPKDIYNSFIREIYSKDRHLVRPAIEQNLAGIIKGAKSKLDSGVITKEDFDEISEMVRDIDTKKEYEHFDPLLYLIPFEPVMSLICRVPPKDRASPLSVEYMIPNLPEDKFDVIVLSKGGTLL